MFEAPKVGNICFKCNDGDAWLPGDLVYKRCPFLKSKSEGQELCSGVITPECNKAAILPILLWMTSGSFKMPEKPEDIAKMIIIADKWGISKIGRRALRAVKGGSISSRAMILTYLGPDIPDFTEPIIASINSDLAGLEPDEFNAEEKEKIKMAFSSVSKDLVLNLLFKSWKI